MAKSKALVKAEGKLKQLHKAVKETEKRVKLLIAKDAKADLAKKKAAAKKKVVSKKKVVVKKKTKAAPKKKPAAKRKVKKATKVAGHHEATQVHGQ